MSRVAGFRMILVRGLRVFSGMLMGGLVLDVLWQVVSRYLLGSPSPWTEELARILLIWVYLMGASVVFLHKGHLGLDYFVKKMPKKKQMNLEALSYTLIALFSMYVLIYGGGELAYSSFSHNEVTPALGISRGWIFLALPVSGAFFLMFCLENLARLFGQQFR